MFDIGKIFQHQHSSDSHLDDWKQKLFNVLLPIEQDYIKHVRSLDRSQVSDAMKNTIITIFGHGLHRLGIVSESHAANYAKLLFPTYDVESDGNIWNRSNSNHADVNTSTQTTARAIYRELQQQIGDAMRQRSNQVRKQETFIRKKFKDHFNIECNDEELELESELD